MSGKSMRSFTMHKAMLVTLCRVLCTADHQLFRRHRAEADAALVRPGDNLEDSVVVSVMPEGDHSGASVRHDIAPTRSHLLRRELDVAKQSFRREDAAVVVHHSSRQQDILHLMHLMASAMLGHEVDDKLTELHRRIATSLVDMAGPEAHDAAVPTPAAPAAPAPAAPEVEKALDERLSRLRRWLKDALKSTATIPAAANWSSGPWTSSKESIEWLVGNGCSGGAVPRAPDCTQVCGRRGFTCDLESLEPLTEEAQVEIAVNASDSPGCARMLPIEFDGEWDGPWVDGAFSCGFVTRRRKWIPSCTMQPHCGYHRLCPCKAPAGLVLPSLQRQSMAQWHRRWDHACQSPDVVQQLLQQQIPRHWHFVLILERAQWINASSPSQLISADSIEYKQLDGYEQLLIENMRYSLALNEAESVHFLDDSACRYAIEKADPLLLAIFHGESDIRFKTDICRIAALYNEGGYYFDDDMHSYSPVTSVIQEDTRFATARGVSPDGKEFFQSFIASTPCHPILKHNLEMLVAARMPNAPPKYAGLLGPVTLKLAWDEANASHTQLLQEISYNPQNKSYEPEPSRNGHSCEFAVIDPATKKMLFCSRI